MRTLSIQKARRARLTSDESNIDALVERLEEEGCDDALVGVGQPGQLALEFIREVAVGTAVACRPPHRSVRAELPHTAPALGT
jgi:hypothetical protein